MIILQFIFWEDYLGGYNSKINWILSGHPNVHNFVLFKTTYCKRRLCLQVPYIRLKTIHVLFLTGKALCSKLFLKQNSKTKPLFPKRSNKNTMIKKHFSTTKCLHCAHNYSSHSFFLKESSRMERHVSNTYPKDFVSFFVPTGLSLCCSS